MSHKTFCKICGVNVTNEKNKDITDEDRATWNETAKGFEPFVDAHHPVNLRVLGDVDVGKLEIIKTDNEIEPKYVNP